MSWQAYVDTELVGKGTVSKAAIVGQQGGIWAISPDYKLSQAEQNFVVNVIKDPTSAFGSGITLGGQKFITIGASPTEVIGRKGEKGVFIVPTKQAILVAEYDAPIIAGDCNVTVNKLADYLKEVGY